MSDKKKSSVKTISYVMVISLIGKVLGLIRDRLLTINYGSGPEANAFLTASRIPRVFFDAVFASAITASFIPVFNEYLENKGKKEADGFGSNFVSVIGLLTLAMSILGIVFAGPLVTLFADGYDAETAVLCVKLTRIMFPTVLFTGIAYSFVGILQSYEQFNVPALISIVANAIVIIYYCTLNGKFGIFGLSAAFLIGWFMQAAVQTPSLIKTGYIYKPDFRFNTGGMKKTFTLMLPVMVSTWVQPINLTINSKFGSRLYDGAGVSAIELSNNLYLLIVGVLILSITNVIFPMLSRMSAKNEKQSVADTVRNTLHSSLYLVIPMMLGLMILSKPLIALIYGGGEFGEFSIDITSSALFFISLGMVGYTVQAVISRIYFSEQNGRVPLVAGIVSIAVNIVMCLLLTDSLSVVGLALSSAAAITINAVVMFIPLKKHGYKILTTSFLADMLKITAAAVIMAIAAYFTLTGLSSTISQSGGTLEKILLVALPTIAGVIVYFVFTTLFRVNESTQITAFIKKRLGKG